MKSFRSRSLVLVLALVIQLSASAQIERVVVRPEETEEVLINPGMGITTFQRFNGEPLNQGLRWSEEGPTAKRMGSEIKSDFPNTSIAYCRWFWNELQPTAERTASAGG